MGRDLGNGTTPLSVFDCKTLTAPMLLSKKAAKTNRSLHRHLTLQSPKPQLTVSQPLQNIARRLARELHLNSASTSFLHFYHASSSPCWELTSFMPFDSSSHGLRRA